MVIIELTNDPANLWGYKGQPVIVLKSEKNCEFKSICILCKITILKLLFQTAFVHINRAMEIHEWISARKKGLL